LLLRQWKNKEAVMPFEVQASTLWAVKKRVLTTFAHTGLLYGPQLKTQVLNRKISKNKAYNLFFYNKTSDYRILPER
jgi:hypothetical protein